MGAENKEACGGAPRMIYKVRCKTCGGVSTIDTESKTWDTTYPPETSPYGGRFPHPTMKDCPLTSGLSPEELIKDPRVEVL
jgi:hypothetical protein